LPTLVLRARRGALPRLLRDTDGLIVLFQLYSLDPVRQRVHRIRELHTLLRESAVVYRSHQHDPVRIPDVAVQGGVGSGTRGTTDIFAYRTWLPSVRGVLSGARVHDRDRLDIQGS